MTKVKHTSRLMKDIEEFHKKFKLPFLKKPGLLDPEYMTFRVRFIQEETDELMKAYAAGNLVEALDALVDITYVTLGTAYLMGMPFDDGWKTVHSSNMKKKRAKSADQSKRGSGYDVVKPEGWQKPNIAKVLEKHGVKA